MIEEILHVFRNTPFGREVFLQTLYFARAMGLSVRVYIPGHKSFLMYFENDVVQVDLDDSYMSHPETAAEHARQLMAEAGVQGEFTVPTEFTASTLPDLPVHFDYMCCPRSMTDQVHKIGPGYIGPRVRKLIQSAPFPVLAPSLVYKEWNSVAVFFGGSVNALKALRLGMDLAERANLPLDLFTFQEGDVNEETLKKALAEHRLSERVGEKVRDWKFFSEGSFVENIWDVPHNALTVMGAYGHGIIKDFLFGSKLEAVLHNLSNTLLIAGPYCKV